MKWYLGTMNDGLFIINAPPRPSADYQFHERTDGPSVVLNVSDLGQERAQQIVDAHNSSQDEETARNGPFKKKMDGTVERRT